MLNRKIFVWILLLLTLLIAGCVEEEKPKAEPAGISAEDATHHALSTAIAVQSQATEGPTTTPFTIGIFPTATPTPTEENAMVATTGVPTDVIIPTTADTTTEPDSTVEGTTPAPTVVALASLSDLQSDHFWIARPFFAEGDIVDHGDSSYRFGSTGGGRLQLHHGSDIGNPQGTPVMAVEDGKVFFAGNDFQSKLFGPSANFYGNTVVLEHTKTIPHTEKQFVFYTLYGHLSEIYVSTGQTVEQFQEIGLVGQTGVAIGPHLHLEVRIGDPHDYNAVYNPDMWIESYPGEGVLVGRASTTSGELLREVEVLAVSLATGSIYRTFTYASDEVRSDPVYKENFVIPDLPNGEYEVRVAYGGRIVYSRIVMIEPQTVMFVNVQVEG